MGKLFFPLSWARQDLTSSTILGGQLTEWDRNINGHSLENLKKIVQDLQSWMLLFKQFPDEIYIQMGTGEVPWSQDKQNNKNIDNNSNKAAMFPIVYSDWLNLVCDVVTRK